MSLDLARGPDFQRMIKGTPGDEVAHDIMLAQLTVWYWFDESSGCPLKRNVTGWLLVVEVVVAIAVVCSQELKYKNVMTTELEKSLEIEK